MGNARTNSVWFVYFLRKFWAKYFVWKRTWTWIFGSMKEVCESKAIFHTRAKLDDADATRFTVVLSWDVCSRFKDIGQVLGHDVVQVVDSLPYSIRGCINSFGVGQSLSWLNCLLQSLQHLNNSLLHVFRSGCISNWFICARPGYLSGRFSAGDTLYHTGNIVIARITSDNCEPTRLAFLVEKVQTLFPFTSMWDNYTRMQPNIENKWITDCTSSGEPSKSSGKSPKHITNRKEFYQNKKQNDSRKILDLGQEWVGV